MSTLSDQDLLRLAKETCVEMRLPEEIHPELRLAIWGNRGRFWPEKSTIRVRFKNGDKKQQALARERFERLDALTGLSFKFVTSGPAEIRVAFNRGSGHWSYVGTDNLSIPQQHQTMNIDLTGRDSAKEWDRVVLHEGLHGLGFNHEHQHPLDKIKWNKPAVYSLYSRTQGWSKQEIDRQVLQSGNPIGFAGTPKLDTKSIMMYATPKSLLLDPKYASGWNYDLSPQDVEKIREIYP